MRLLRSLTVAIASLLLVVGCGGGGGGSSSGSGGGGSSSGSLSGLWTVSAPVSKRGCDDRIAAVTQNFTISQNGSALAVDTGIITLLGVLDGDAFTIGFDETTTECSRNYNATFSAITDTTANVSLTSKTTCGSVSCENTWTGSATKK